MKKSGDEPDFVCDQALYDLVITMELTREDKDQMAIPSSIVSQKSGSRIGPRPNSSPVIIILLPILMPMIIIQVAMLVGINLRKEGQHFKPLAVQQYIQSLNGQLFKLKVHM